MKPTIAVWMVTYNHEAYIAQAIESVMMQETDFDFKLFIGEDCSTDDTRAICIELQNKYSEQIELILNTTNLGSQLNAFQIYEACLQSGAPYMALLEGDDYWTDPLKLQKQVAFLEANPSYTFSFTRFLSGTSEVALTDKNAHFFKDDSNLVYDFDMFTKGWHGGTLTLLFRSSCLCMTDIKAYNYFRDIHLYTILLKQGNGICMNFISAVYHIHEYGQHNSLDDLEQAKIAVLCYQELLKKNGDIPQIKKKYRYFFTEYIKILIERKRFYSAFKQNLFLALETQDFYIFKKELKRIIEHAIFKANKEKK